jgi:hypothetical protein
MDNPKKVSHLTPLHHGDQPLETGKSVIKQHLVNKLNFINFQDGTIFINFKHTKFGNSASLQAKPLPCGGDRLDCIWLENPALERIVQTYTLESFLIAEGKKLFLVKPERIISISPKMVSLRLPETCDEVLSRQVHRYPCEGIRVQLIQNSAFFQGDLIDFSAVSFSVQVSAVPPQTFQWVNPETPTNLIITDGTENIFSGECRIVRQTDDQKTRTFVLEPLNQRIRRFAPKEFRSTRLKLIPSPDIIFVHPLTKKTVNLKVIDLSGSGFSVEEREDAAVLLPGLMIPELELSYANGIRFTCKSQVIYRKTDGECDHELVRCGLAILDMDPKDHVRHLALLHQASDGKAYVCNEVDLDTLWNFFFETGFIYPQKYAFIQANKEKLKETYEKLYNSNPNIARHFIYQDKGVIFGHMAMVRFYENSWMIHHHAAIKSESMKSGLMVLNQISRYVNDIHNFYSAHLNFVFCYFRPDNKFPSRIFGGFAKHLNDPGGCSLDTFAYFHFQRPFKSPAELMDPWQLTEGEAEDLQELESFYGQESGGLMLQALDLGSDMVDRARLSREYQKLNFKRESKLFSLRKDGNLKAIILVNVSDIGLNLSNLTNCAKIIALDGEDLPRDIFSASLAHISAMYDENEMPVLLYPVTYAESQAIPYEKLYTMWVLNLQYLDKYFKFCDTLFRRF